MTSSALTSYAWWPQLRALPTAADSQGLSDSVVPDSVIPDSVVPDSVVPDSVVALESAPVEVVVSAVDELDVEESGFWGSRSVSVPDTFPDVVGVPVVSFVFAVLFVFIVLFVITESFVMHMISEAD